MPTIATAFKLNKTQPELDFVDVVLNRDNRLFVDPFAISQELDSWSRAAATTIGEFFQQVTEDIRRGDEGHARQLLLHLREPNETRLGFSRRQPNGAGIGSMQADDLLAALKDSAAVKSGFLQALEESELMIEGISHDKISDLTTNIIRGNLVAYTAEQCRLHGISVQEVAVPPIFDPTTMEWRSQYVDLPIWRQRPILFVPKAIVRFSPAYKHGEYYQHHVLNFLQAEELANPRLGLVRIITNQRRKTERRVVYKKDISERFPRTKQYLYEFSREHPEVLETYRERLREIEAADTPSDVDTEDERVISDALIELISTTPTGDAHASAYHNLMIGVVEFLFYPKLVHPQKEREIHQGRKRIDIVCENNAREGIFNILPTTRRVPCGYVPIECKNYGREVGNPELDQLSGRFSVNRGQVGILCCRSFHDRRLFVQRCHDTYIDGRGIVIPLDDDTVMRLLGLVGAGDRNGVDRSISELVNEVCLA